MQLFLNHEAAVDQTDNDGCTPLYVAACNGHTGAVQILLRHKAAVDKARDNGMTPL